MKKEKPVDIADVLKEMRESLEKVNDSIEGMKRELRKKL